MLIPVLGLIGWAAERRVHDDYPPEPATPDWSSISDYYALASAPP